MTQNHYPIRHIFAIILTLMQIVLIIGAAVILYCYVPYFSIAANLIEIICIIRIASSDENPDYKVPWLLIVIFLPVAGFIFYFLFYSRKIPRKYLKNLQNTTHYLYPYNEKHLFQMLKQTDLSAFLQAKLLCKIAETHLFVNTGQHYFVSGEEMYQNMLNDLKKAEKFIFLEYFILERGVFWDSILEILKKKVSAGIAVKVIYDDIGCMLTLPEKYDRELQQLGIDAVRFATLHGQADGGFNNRSHRKMLIIDGKIGYTGGINLADEYINKVTKYGHWKDTGIRLEGEAVWEMTRLFGMDYRMATQKHMNIPDLFPRHTVSVSGFIVPFGDGPRPIYTQNIAKAMIRALLANAVSYVSITTPYLVIDHALCQSIEDAALRGVHVKIIVPHIPDKKLVFIATKSFYKRLIRAGAAIYEYTPGFIHAKTYIVDDRYALLGTMNLDYRSLAHHFENGIWMYDTESIRDIRCDFETTLCKCRRITEKDLHPHLLERCLRCLLRIFAPLL